MNYWYRCNDAHSGCKDVGDVKEVSYPLTNRKSSFDSGKNYSDNVNNVTENSTVQVKFQEIEKVKKTCWGDDTKPDELYCAYNVVSRVPSFSDITNTPLLPLIDTNAPVVNAEVTVSDDNNPIADSEPIWNLYAGKINIKITAKDLTTNPSQSGVSGIKNMYYFIEDSAGNKIYQ